MTNLKKHRIIRTKSKIPLKIKCLNKLKFQCVQDIYISLSVNKSEKIHFISQFVSHAKLIVPHSSSTVPSLLLALRPEMGFLPLFAKYLLITPSLSSLPSRLFCLTAAGSASEQAILKGRYQTYDMQQLYILLLLRFRIAALQGSLLRSTPSPTSQTVQP